MTTEKHGHAVIHGVLDQELMRRPLKVAYGNHMRDMAWGNTDGTIGSLIAQLCTFVRSDNKDGLCLVQGEMVHTPGGVPRIWRNMRACHLMMFDYDTGVPIDEVHKQIEALGWLAVVWTTYNHLKTKTEIAEDKLHRYVTAKYGVKTTPQEKDVLDYFRDVLQIHPSIASTAVFAGRQQVVGGVKYTVQHAPCPRIRAAFFLKDPFIFAERGGTQVDAKAEWESLYAGVSTHRLHLPYDTSCTDPSRLMFTPRIPPTATIGPGAHEIRVITGKLLDLAEIPPVVAGGRPATTPSGERNAFTDAAAAAGVTGDGTEAKFVTRNLHEFLKRAGDDFDFVQFLTDMEPGARLDDQGHFTCPNVDAHTNPVEGDKAFRVFQEGGSWGASCRHDSCIRACKNPSTGKQDRAFFLDRACARYGITDALDLIREAWTPTAWREQQPPPSSGSYDEIDTLVASLTSSSAAADVTRAVTLLARRPQHEIVEVAQRMRAITEATGQRRKDLDALLHGEQRRLQAAGGTNGAGIFANQCAGLRRRIEQNNLPPTLFITASDPIEVVRVNIRRRRIEEMTHDRWVHELNKRARTTDPLESNEIQQLKGDADWDLPVLKSLSTVPVFDAAGELCTTNGYDPNTGLYLVVDDSFTIPPQPEKVTQEHVDEALRWLLEEAARDFPFSDSFEGGDNTPIHVDEVDETGWPYPNYNRGLSSRAHFLAMIIQPFVRNMISGPCPSYHIDKTRHGEGGTLLTTIPASIWGGEPLPAQPAAKDHDEFQKALLATLRGGPAYILFDNMDGPFSNPDLAMAITAQRYVGRKLGSSELIKCDVVGSFLYTGVGIAFSKELHRRNVPIRLDGNTAEPTKRKFKHNCEDFLRQHRGQLIWSVLVLVRNWVQGGKVPGQKTIGSFEEWAKVMGGILGSAGVDGFLDSWDNYWELANDDKITEQDLVETLAQVFGRTPFSASDIITELSINPLTSGALEVLNLLPTNNDENAMKNKMRVTTFIKKYVTGRTWSIERGGGYNAIVNGVRNSTKPAREPALEGAPLPHNQHAPTKKPAIEVSVRTMRSRSPASWHFAYEPKPAR